MARPVEYDLEKVLDSAMEIFWQKGYESVSMAELVSYTGLNRRTMYSLFKDKKGLFRDALENYYLKRSAQKLALLQEHSGKNGIELFFQSFVFGDNFKGCLFSNTIGEKEFMDEETYSIPKAYFESIRTQLEVNLTQAKEENEFTGNAVAMSHTLVAFIHGFQVYGKYNHSKEDGQAIIKNILETIK